MMESPASRKVHKSRTDRMIDGVCAGVAEYFGWDVTIVRLIWLSTIMFGGTGIVAYIAAMILLPAESSQGISPDVSAARQEKKRSNQGLFVGVTLILIGLIFLFDEMHIISRHWFWFHFPWEFVLPSLFIIAGMALIFWPLTRTRVQNGMDKVSDMSGMRRNLSDKKIWGVCAGLAMHLGIDASIVRILWIAVTFVTFPLAIFLYILMAILIPDENGKRIFDSKTAPNQS